MEKTRSTRKVYGQWKKTRSSWIMSELTAKAIGTASPRRQVLLLSLSLPFSLLFLFFFFFCNPGVPHLRGSFPWARLGSGPLHPGGLYLGWGQGPTPSTAFGDRMDSSPPPGVEPVSMTIGPQSSYQVSYLIPSCFCS